MNDKQADNPTVDIEIDGKSLSATPGEMIIEVADKAGIVIPRFCYHKKLSIAANCRMCLVEVENAPKPMPACATPVMKDMRVFTRSKKTIAYQKAVMQFLLINHPLDCPICDQGGECELQDLSMGYGSDVSNYTLGKRTVKDEDIGPLIATDLTRCIQCSRCVRFGEEITGMKELGMLSRGEHAEISTFLHQHVDSEMSGNVIDLCPVGALTSKPFRYKARAWEMQQHESIAPHDCVGSHVNVHVRFNEVMRVVPRENEAINEVWLSDRDRFSYEALSSEDRLTSPMIKRDGDWEKVDWSEALKAAAKKIKAVVKKQGPKAFGALASPCATTEEFYLLQDLMHGLGSFNVDHRLRQCDFAHQRDIGDYPGLNCSLEQISLADVILIVGSDLRQEQPIIHHRVRQASLKGAHVFVINPAVFKMNMSLKGEFIANILDLPTLFAELAKGVSDATPDKPLGESATTLFSSLSPQKGLMTAAKALCKAKNPVVLAGQIAINHPQASLLYRFIEIIGTLTHAAGGYMTDGANTTGAWLAGAVPHRGPGGQENLDPGLDAKQMLGERTALGAYLLLNVEPELDCAYGSQALDHLNNAECVVALSTFMGEGIKQCADIILPIAAFTETSGTFINAMGDWQSFKGAVKPKGDARPAWKVLRVLANFLGLKGFDYASSDAVLNRFKAELAKEKKPLQDNRGDLPAQLPSQQQSISRLATVPLYAGDALVRRANALNQTNAAKGEQVVRLSPTLATSLGFKAGGMLLISQNKAHGIRLPLVIDDTLPDKTVLVPMGLSITAALGEGFSELTLMEVNN